MVGANKVKAGGGEPDFGHEGAMLVVFRERVLRPVVSEVVQAQQSAPGHVGADVPSDRQMAPNSAHSPSLSRGTPVRHYPR